MALAHKAGCSALLHQRCECGMRAQAPLFKLRKFGDFTGGFEQGANLLEILLHRPRDTRCRTEIAAHGGCINTGNLRVESCHFLGQGIQMLCCQFAAGQHVVKQRRLLKTPHFHGVFDGFGCVVIGQLWPARAADNGDDFQVEARRQTAIEAQFLQTEVMPEFQRGEV